jgi:hypothetical protein
LEFLEEEDELEFLDDDEVADDAEVELPFDDDERLNPPDLNPPDLRCPCDLF